MKNIYQPPRANLLDQAPSSANETLQHHDEAQALRALLKEQRVILSPVIGVVVAWITLLLLFYSGGGAPMLVLVLPAFIAGGIVKYLGKLIQARHRIITSGLVAFFVFTGIASSNFVFPLLIAFLVFLICLALTRRPLSYDQERLLYKWKLGKLTPA